MDTDLFWNEEDKWLKGLFVMVELLETLYGDDDLLGKSFTSHSLYDKNILDLSFADNNNGKKGKDSVSDMTLLSLDSTFLLPAACGSGDESPNLDFLNLGSPDLEQIFMNIENEKDFVEELSNDAISISPSSKTTSDFIIGNDSIGVECYLTDALQQLHDKQTNDAIDPNSLLDIPIKLEEEDSLTVPTFLAPKPKCNVQEKKSYAENSSLQRKQNQSKFNSRTLSQIRGEQLMRDVPKHENNEQKTIKNFIVQQHQQQRKRYQQSFHNVVDNNQLNPNSKTLEHHLTEQMVLNNQAIIQHHQEQHEIALLQQAINFHKQQQQATHTPTTQLRSKMLHPHMLQHLSQPSHYHVPSNMNNRNHIQHGNTYRQMNDYDTNSAIDEPTLKMFAENPHMAPINLDIQDLIKRERKKLRNRIASSKCRKRKLEREGKLENKVKVLREKNIELNALANSLKQQICDLKQRVMEHVSEGCHIIMP